MTKEQAVTMVITILRLEGRPLCREEIAERLPEGVLNAWRGRRLEYDVLWGNPEWFKFDPVTGWDLNRDGK